MKSGAMRFICRMLIVSVVMLPLQTVQAGMIGTDQVVTAAQAKAARATVDNFIGRAEVAAQLQALGLTGRNANKRVAALTDTEVSNLAGQIDSLPAGATDPLVGVILLVAVIYVVLWFVQMKK